MRKAPLCALVLGVAACGPTLLATGPTVPTVVQVASDTERSVITISDVETVHDVFETDGRVWVATNLGLFSYLDSGGAAEKSDWLPEGSVSAVFRSGNGTVLAALGHTLWTRSAYDEVKSVTLSGSIVDLAALPQRGFFACTKHGLWRSLVNAWDGWQRAELALDSCEALFVGSKHLWVIGDEGRALVELSGDVAHLHQQALADLVTGHKIRVLSVATLANGEALALLSAGDRVLLALYRDEVWRTYTSLPFDGEVLGLVASGSPQQAWLVTTGGHFIIDVSLEGEGVAAVPVSVGRPDRVPAWKPRWLPRTAASFVQPAVEQLTIEPQRTPQRFVDAPSDPPDAPSLRFLLVDHPSPIGTPTIYAAKAGVFVAPPHQGVVRIRGSGETQHYRTRSLVPSEGSEYRLSLAHHQGKPMLIAANGEVLGFEDGRLSVIPVGDEMLIQSLASRGDRLIAAGPSLQNETSIAIYAFNGDAFELSRTADTGARLASVPHLGLSDEGDIWAAIRVTSEDGTDIPRGVLWLPADGREPVAFHRGVEIVEGATAKPAPDNVFDLDLGQGGFAWLATFSGAVRIGDDQVVVFGQARGVPGESVYDVHASNERMWFMAAGGPGTYDNRDLDFKLPETARATKATRVATHGNDVWLAGPGGVAQFDGQAWHPVPLPNTNGGRPLDVDIDQSGRVWLLLENELLLIDPRMR